MRSRSPLILLTLLWLIGIALRLAILAVPPVIPTLRDEFNLSGTEIGILSGVPIVVFGVAALAGSRLVASIGVVAAVVVGLLLTAAGSAGRGGASHVMGLLVATVIMGVGVAVTQPAIPALVGRWLPDRIVLATGVYTNGLLVGEILPVALFPFFISRAWPKLARDFCSLGGADRRHSSAGIDDVAASGACPCGRIVALVA